VLIITTGQAEQTRECFSEQKIACPVVLQQHWEISRRYAMVATPIAHLIDEADVITHDVAVGGDSILKLLSGAAREKPIAHGNAEKSEV
jgi:hypothetical protein